MNFCKFILLILLIIGFNAKAEKYSSDYFKLGNWHLGEKQKEILNAEDFKEFQLNGNDVFFGSVKTIFSENSEVKFYFNKKSLERTEITVYKGSSYIDALKATELAISTITTEFGGANLEGLTTSKGLKPEMATTVIGQLKSQSDKAIKEINNEDPNKEIYYSMFFSLSTEYMAKKNFIYGKFSYFGENDTYELTIYEDSKFNPSHLYKSNIFLSAKKKS